MSYKIWTKHSVRFQVLVSIYRQTIIRIWNYLHHRLQLQVHRSLFSMQTFPNPMISTKKKFPNHFWSIPIVEQQILSCKMIVVIKVRLIVARIKHRQKSSVRCYVRLVGHGYHDQPYVFLCFLLEQQGLSSSSPRSNDSKRSPLDLGNHLANNSSTTNGHFCAHPDCNKVILEDAAQTRWWDNCLFRSLLIRVLWQNIS